MRCTRLAETQDAKITQKIAICAPSHNFVGLSSQLMHVSTIGKKLLNSNMCSTSSQNMVNLGPMAEIGSGVSGTPANFNDFCVLTSLLHRRHAKKVNQTLHDVWPSPRLVHYIYIFWGSCPVAEFCQVQNSLCVQVLRCPILTALLHDTHAVGVSQTLRRGIFTRQGGHPVRHWADELSSLLRHKLNYVFWHVKFFFKF